MSIGSTTQKSTTTVNTPSSPLIFPLSDTEPMHKKTRILLDAFLAVDAVAYLREHISINIAHSSQPTPIDNLDAAQLGDPL